ncbi:MAG TPA: carbon-nitrogen hydrolase family protein [Nitrososphaeraceae archaeon]|jgi:deaminated glutathione amidase|nr:carbon-nitrogen hydrolase family protein [Nitrososphaeraceae archaeon]
MNTTSLKLPKFALVAIVQMRSSENKMENLELSVDFIREAAKKKSSMICFPEFQMAYSPVSVSANQLSEKAESVNGGNFIGTLRKAAKVNKISIISTIYEKNDSGFDNRVYDTAVLIDNNGEISSVYRKLHLYDALGFKESDKMMAGNMIEKPAKTSVGNLGLMICYDIRFPEMSRILTVKGANILVSPSAWVHGIMKEEHWQTLLKARAIENGLYIIAPNQIGNIFSGRSMIVDPFGIVLLDMGNREGMEVVEIDKSRVQKVRELLPLLKNRRIDVYGNNTNVFS